jgi:putative endonuclease
MVASGGGEMGDRQDLGRRGEQAAVAYLQGRGVVVVQRNWRCRHGEIDIVAREGETLVFCEVKTRRGVGFGTPLDAITYRKAGRLRLLVGAYLAEAGVHVGPVRIDAIGILWGSDGLLRLEHLRGVA